MRKRGPLSGRGKKKPADPLAAYREAFVTVKHLGRVERVTALRAALLVLVEEIAQPHEWSPQDLELVEGARAAREALVVERLDRDGLLVGSPNCAGSMPVGESIWDARRLLTWLK